MPYRILLCSLASFALTACNEELPFPPGADVADTGDDTTADTVADTGDDTTSDTGACVDGTVRDADDGCNTCTCVSGEWLCTLLPCPIGGCASDDDCVVSGCSAQICASEPMASDCAWLPEYACYREPTTSCGCFDGACAWDATAALRECLADPPCTAGETRDADDGCNTCTCLEDGSWACTLMDCGPDCEPGTRGGDCGECFCADDGFWVCDDVECPVCTPGEEVGAGCERCVCNESGLWDCGVAPGCVGCTPGEERPAGDGCNTCVCDDTERWACTEIACGTECNADTDCVVSGCSGQICAAEERFTTCEWLPWYACFHDSDVTTCTCNDGRCGWDPTEALGACLAADGPP